MTKIKRKSSISSCALEEDKVLSFRAGTRMNEKNKKWLTHKDVWGGLVNYT